MHKITNKMLTFIVLTLAFFAISNSVKAQNVIRKGNTFVQIVDTVPTVKTQYTYETKDGNKYPIYLSSKGKAFIICTSKKTGKQYRRYLPKVTEQINKNSNK